MLLVLFAATAFAQEPQGTPTPSPTPDSTEAATPTPAVSLEMDANAGLDMNSALLADFVRANPYNGFRWLDAARDTAQNIRHGLTLFKIPVAQVIVRASAGKITEVVFLFYNRGDNGDMERENFEALKKKCAEAVTAFTGLQASQPAKDPTNAVKAEGLVWQNTRARFLLESSYTRLPDAGFRAEFVRLTMTAPEKQKSLLEENQSSLLPTARFDGPSHVKTMPNGDVIIQDIPMVDQGRKGYCVVASAERVLRYYGKRVDENELAQIADTSTKGGTSPKAMIESLKMLANRLQIKTRALEEFDGERLDGIIEDYNRFATKGQRAPALDIAGARTYGDLFEKMDPDILKESRTKNPSEMNRFFRTVQARVNQGTPPLWSVMMGLFPHGTDPAEFGGHMRLIIGYNLKTNEILYSDPWGYGHELSRMPLENAWTITTGLSAIEPL